MPAGKLKQINYVWIKKIKTVSSDLSKQSNALDNDVIKKTLYIKLVIKVTVISTKILNTSRLLTKTKYDSDEEGLEKKITDVDKKIPKVLQKKKTNYNKTSYNTKTTEIANKIPSVTSLVFTASLNAKATQIGSKIPDTTGFIATPEFST